MNSSGSGVKNTICFVILFLLIVDDSYQLQIERYEPIGSRTKRQATCTNRQFQCKDGGCIPRYELCDGEVNCDDRSDETVACRNINLSCPAGSFRCNYGACIPGTQECDGEKNCVDNSDENSPKCSGRATTPPVTNVACRNNQFRCRNGQCIARYSRCDGAQDCTDGSDETEELCSNEKCDTNLFFQCKYGACVDKAGRCNKEKDCADNSDEDPAMCGYSVTSKPPETVTKKQSAGDCQLPEQPEFGRYLINWEEQKLPAGSWVASGTNLVYSCRSVYRLNTPHNIIPCFNGTWQGRLPQCLSTCFPRISNTVDLTCTRNGIPQNCSDRLLEGTVVKMECKPYHVLQVVSNALSKELKCKDGSWNNPLLPCVPGQNTRFVYNTTYKIFTDKQFDIINSKLNKVLNMTNLELLNAKLDKLLKYSKMNEYYNKLDRMFKKKFTPNVLKESTNKYTENEIRTTENISKKQEGIDESMNEILNFL